MSNRDSKNVDYNTIICRCEDISLGEIKVAIADGYTTVDELKHYLRVGMGPCQSRTCGTLIAGIIARETGKPVDEVYPMTSRPPYHPVTLGTLLNEE